MKDKTYLPTFGAIEADICATANAAHEYVTSFLWKGAEHSVGFKRQAEVACYLLSTGYTSSEVARLRYYAAFEGDKFRAFGNTGTDAETAK